MKESPLRLQERRYTLRKKGLKGLLAFLIITTVAMIAVALWVAAYRNASVSSRRQNLPQNVARQLSGYTFTRSQQGRRLFTLHAARTLAYNQGSSTVLDDVHVVIFGRTGSWHDEIEAKRCLYDTVSGALACSGNAVITLPAPVQGVSDARSSGRPPIIVHTSNPSYDPHTSVVKTNEAVRFQYGVDSGAARGMAYNTQTGELQLNKDVTFELEPKPDAKTPLRVSAGSLTFAKRLGQIFLQSAVRLSEADRYLASATGGLRLDARGRVTSLVLGGGVEAFALLPSGNFHGRSEAVAGVINPDDSQLERLDAVGSVHLTLRQEPRGDVRHLSAQHVLLEFAGHPAKPQAGVASGEVEVVYEPAPPATRAALGSKTRAPGGERETVLTTGELHFRLHPAGGLEAASTVGPGKICLIPRSPSAARRTVTAGHFQMIFDQQGRLETVYGLSGSGIVSQPGPGAPRGSESQTTKADRLEARLDPSTGTIKSLRQSGHFQFWQTDRRANSDAAYYQAASQLLTLKGHPGIWGPDSRIQAQHIQVNLGGGVARAWGSVQSIYFDHAGRATTRGVKRQTDTAPDDPLVILADQLTAKRNSQFAHYQGNVKAWYGPNVVESSSLDVYRKQQQVRSGFGVLSRLVPARDGRGNSASKRPVSERLEQPLTIGADRLIYFNLAREAVYQGHVHAESENTTLHADRLEAYFSKPPAGAEPAVTRVVADGDLTVVQVPDRRATGRHAVYFAGLGKIVLTGGPPIIYDAKQGVVTAKRLTFFTYDDSLVADGGPKTPAVSKYHVARQ